jgi:hypothetical protein
MIDEALADVEAADPFLHPGMGRHDILDVSRV